MNLRLLTMVVYFRSMKTRLLLCTFLFACTTTVAPEPEVSSSSSLSSTAPFSEFTMNEQGNFEADVAVEGYGEVTQIEEPFCRENCETEQCKEDCKEYDYVYFTITKNGNAEFAKFLQDNSGDPFGTNQAVGLGCLNDGIIEYSNHTDEFEMKEFTLSEADTAAIMNATAEAPVTVRLQKLPLSAGRGAPVCYSHFTYVTVQ